MYEEMFVATLHPISKMGVDDYQVVSMMPTERKFHSVNRGGR